MTGNEWIVPNEIVSALGDFDLDPCAPEGNPFPVAPKYFTSKDDGLKQEWQGRVWLNPPLDQNLSKWFAKMAAHGNGIVLAFNRTWWACFHESVFGVADAMLIMPGSLKYHDLENPNGNSVAPSVLIAYGAENAQILKRSGLPGAYLKLN